jgi:hypothetical protein
VTLVEGNFWFAVIWIFGAGVVGGIANALMTDNGFLLPKSEQSKAGRIIRPGFLATAFIGGLAAGVSFLLYGSAANLVVIGGTQPANVQVTAAALGGAVILGIGGARWLTNEVDKTLLKAAAIEAAEKGQADPAKSRPIANLRPSAVLEYAKTEL